MDIDFNLSQMSQYISYASGVLENISYSFNEFKGLFSETQNVIEIINQKIKTTSLQIQEMLNRINILKDGVSKKILSVPDEKPYKNKPQIPNFEGKKLEVESKKQAYELICAKIDKENNIIKLENEKNNKEKIELININEKLNSIFQKLESFDNRCNYMKNFIVNVKSDFLSKKNESEIFFNKSLNLSNQSVQALSNTYSYALPLTEECRYNRVYSDLRNIFKIKKPIKSSTNNYSYDNKVISNSKKNEHKNNSLNKTIIIKSRNKEEFYAELNSSNLKSGDIVKIPSYNLFNLGNDTLFDSMEKLGFKKLSNNGSTIFEDGTISWVKYE